jgi:hypothetical protein
MASRSAMQQDSILISLGGNSAPVLLPLVYFAFGIKEQIQRKPMAGELAPEGSQNAYTIPLSQPVIRDCNQ